MSSSRRLLAAGASGPQPQILITDSFNRPDELDLSYADTGEPWIKQSGVIGVTNNKALCTAGAQNTCVIDVGTPDVWVGCTPTVWHDGPLCFWSEDNLNHFVTNISGRLYNREGTSNYTIRTSGGFTGISGYEYALRLEGDIVECWVNGILTTWVSLAGIGTRGTKHGLRFYRSGSVYEVDNFFIYDLAYGDALYGRI